MFLAEATAFLRLNCDDDRHPVDDTQKQKVFKPLKHLM